MTQPPSVIRSARTVSIAVLGSRVLGLVREQVLAGLFGAHVEFDAFVTAFRIPNLLRDLFAEGALSSAFLTTFKQKLTTEGDQSAWRLANLVSTAMVVVLGGITVVGIIATPWLVNAIAPGFQNIEGKAELTILLTRIMFPFLLMVALAALAMGMLNAKHRFGVPASASMMFNIGSIVGGLVFGYMIDPSFGPRAIIGMAIGTLIGGIAQWLIQVPSLRAVGFRYKPMLDWHDSGFRRVLYLIGPSVIGVAAVQVNVFVDNWYASFFGNGAVSWLNCAFRLMQFPIGLFGVAIGVATLPTVTSLVARGEMNEFRLTLSRSIRLAIFLCLPSACGLAVLAQPIISVIYEHGRFDALATAQTALCLQSFALGLVGYASIKVIGPTFYALGDARTPMYVSLASILLNMALNYIFAIKLDLQTAGLALATGCVALTNFFLLLILMSKKIGGWNNELFGSAIIKIMIASAIMTGASYATHTVIDTNRYLNLAAAIGVGVGVFFLCCRLLRVSELGELFSVLGLGAFNPKKTGNTEQDLND